MQEYYEKLDPINVDFEIIMTNENLRMAKEEGQGLVKEFNLTTTISTSDMLLFDQNRAIKKYDNPEQILEEFFKLRLDLYKKRREMLLEDLELEISKLGNTKRFISSVLNDDINLFAKDAIVELQENEESCNSYEYLLSMGFQTFNKEKVMELDSQTKNLNLQLKELVASTPETLWMKDLNSLDQKQ